MRCPKCGKEVDDKETLCPFCGETLTSKEIKEEPFEAIPPKDPSWVNEWRKKVLIIGIAIVVAAIVFTILVCNGNDGFMSFLMAISYFFGIPFLVAYIYELRIKRIYVQTIDGYPIVFYFRMKYNVIVEDKIVNNNPTQFVYPSKKQFVITLPNKKTVIVDVYDYLKKVKIYEENKL